MPVRKVKGGYQYGETGKVYKEKSKAKKQETAVNISKQKEKQKYRKESY